MKLMWSKHQAPPANRKPFNGHSRDGREGFREIQMSRDTLPKVKATPDAEEGATLRTTPPKLKSVFRLLKPPIFLVLSFCIALAIKSKLIQTKIFIEDTIQIKIKNWTVRNNLFISYLNIFTTITRASINVLGDIFNKRF